MISRSMHQVIYQIIAWFRSYQQLYEKTNPPTRYRVIDIKKNRKQETYLVVQHIGKSTVFECNPMDIVSAIHMLENFSKQDVRTITYLAYMTMSAPQYTIVSQLLDEGPTRFKLKKTGTSEVIVKTAQDIYSDESIISSLSRKDAYLIGYVYASEQTLTHVSNVYGHNRV